MGAPWEAVDSFRLYEVVKYYTEGTPFPVVYFSIAFNKNKWNSLPKDIQDAITKYGGYEGSKWWGKTWFDDAREPAIKKIKDLGFEMNMYELTDAERARWIEVSGKPVWDEWLKKMKAAGHPEAKEILDALLAMKE